MQVTQKTFQLPPIRPDISHQPSQEIQKVHYVAAAALPEFQKKELVDTKVSCPVIFYVALAAFTALGYTLDYFGFTPCLSNL